MDNQTLKIMLAKIKMINNNFNNCIQELDSINNKLKEALVINGNIFYNSDIEYCKKELIIYSNIIKYDIIPELNNII